MSYLHQWNNRGLYRRFFGRISGDEILESNLKLQGDPRFDSINYIVNDFLRISDFDIDSGDIKRISAIDKAAALSNSKIKIANVVKSDSLLAMVNTYIELMKASGYQYMTFDNFEAAEIWCGK